MLSIVRLLPELCLGVLSFCDVWFGRVICGRVCEKHGGFNGGCKEEGEWSHQKLRTLMVRCSLKAISSRNKKSFTFMWSVTFFLFFSFYSLRTTVIREKWNSEGIKENFSWLIDKIPPPPLTQSKSSRPFIDLRGEKWGCETKLSFWGNNTVADIRFNIQSSGCNIFTFSI